MIAELWQVSFGEVVVSFRGKKGGGGYSFTVVFSNTRFNTAER